MSCLYPRSLRTLPRLSRTLPYVRLISTSPARRTPHIEYPASPTKAQSYATPLLPLPTPPTQPPTHGLLVIYTPSPPSEWPPHIELADPFVDAVSKSMALAGVRCIVAHDGNNEGYRATLLTPAGLIASYPSFAHSTLTSSAFTQTVHSLATGHAVPKPLGYTEILVCTHGARDCRCADIGGDLAIALRSELKRREVASGKSIEREAARWKVTDCAHVGGHKCVASLIFLARADALRRWAANAILLPSLTFLSNLRPARAPLIIDHLTSPSDAALKSQLYPSHFRGIIGTPPAEQQATYESSLPRSSPAALAPLPRKRLPVRFTTSDGTQHDVFGFPGESLMEIAKRESLGAIEGTCGGHLGTPPPAPSYPNTHRMTPQNAQHATCTFPTRSSMTRKSASRT